MHAGRLNIEECVSSIKDWCSSRCLQLNADKTEIIWFGSKTRLKKLDLVELSLRLGSTTVEPVVFVRNLGIYMDNEMNMRIHIGKNCSACYFHLRRLLQLRHIVSQAKNAEISIGVYTVTFGLLLLGIGWVAGCYLSSNAESHERRSPFCGRSSYA